MQVLVSSGSLDVHQIERTLDQLLTHACTTAGLTFFQTLCRHYWLIDQQANASYVRAYREMWAGDEQNESEAVHIPHRHDA